MIIKWAENLETGFHIIDGQHHQFIDVLNRLSEAITNNLSQDELAEIFAELYHYATNHFETEEKLFELYQYPLATEHVALHEKFKTDIVQIKTKLNAGDLQEAFRLLDYLEDWFVTHITTEDRKYIECFATHGLK